MVTLIRLYSLQTVFDTRAGEQHPERVYCHSYAQNQDAVVVVVCCFLFNTKTKENKRKKENARRDAARGGSERTAESVVRHKWLQRARTDPLFYQTYAAWNCAHTRAAPSQDSQVDGLLDDSEKPATNAGAVGTPRKEHEVDPGPEADGTGTEAESQRTSTTDQLLV